MGDKYVKNFMINLLDPSDCHLGIDGEIKTLLWRYSKISNIFFKMIRSMMFQEAFGTGEYDYEYNIKTNAIEIKSLLHDANCMTNPFHLNTMLRWFDPESYSKNEQVEPLYEEKDHEGTIDIDLIKDKILPMKIDRWGTETELPHDRSPSLGRDQGSSNARNDRATVSEGNPEFGVIFQNKFGLRANKAMTIGSLKKDTQKSGQATTRDNPTGPDTPIQIQSPKNSSVSVPRRIHSGGTKKPTTGMSMTPKSRQERIERSNFQIRTIFINHLLELYVFKAYAVSNPANGNLRVTSRMHGILGPGTAEDLDPIQESYFVRPRLRLSRKGTSNSLKTQKSQIRGAKQSDAGLELENSLKVSGRLSKVAHKDSMPSVLSNSDREDFLDIGTDANGKERTKLLSAIGKTIARLAQDPKARRDERKRKEDLQVCGDANWQLRQFVQSRSYSSEDFDQPQPGGGRRGGRKPTMSEPKKKVQGGRKETLPGIGKALVSPILLPLGDHGFLSDKKPKLGSDRKNLPVVKGKIRERTPIEQSPTRR
jgi:hypothetical protein